METGGFGKVYQGHSRKYGTIAVKRLDHGNGGQGQHEFMMEIELLSAYKHENLVSLVGFCDQDGEKILVYKHESNGSLDKLLQRKDLNWIQRLKICLGAAKGLKYLHDDVGPQHRVLHRDIKSSNILLDENMKAKISDFGLSKISPANMSSTFLISSPCGTPGYIDPEYLVYGVLTQKSDVYSFAIVLFEVLCGRPARVIEYQDKRHFLCILAQYHYEKGTLDEIIDSDLRKQMNPTSLSIFSTIAYHCLTKCREDRPRMSQIVEELQKALDHQEAASSGLWAAAALQQEHSPSMDIITQSGLTTSSSSPSYQSTLVSSWLRNHSVFFSFRGLHHRNFADDLYKALVRSGIKTFKSEEEIDWGEGESVPPEILRAIRESEIVLIILTKSYVGSSWCLDELAYAMENKDEMGLTVIPIFYNLDPLEYLRNQHGEFGKAITRHKSNVNKVESWRKALEDAMNLSYWPTINTHG